jgi:hypothetical protein
MSPNLEATTTITTATNAKTSMFLTSDFMAMEIQK